MSNRPSDLPSWADSGTIVSPPEQTRDLGFTFRFPPAFQLLNWAWNRFSAWLQHYAEHSTTFEALEDALVTTGQSPLEVGQTCLIDEDDSDDTPLSVAAEYDFTLLANYDGRAVACGGDGVLLALAADGAALGDAVAVRRMNRDGTAAAAYTSTGGLAALLSLESDGAIVVLGSRTDVEVWDYSTTALLWDVNGLAVVTATIPRAVALDTVHVYYTDGDDVVACLRATGVEVWRYDHGAEVASIAVDGEALYLIGEPSAGDSMTIRRLRASDGAEVGTATFGWEDDDTVSIGSGAVIAVDEHRLYVVRPTGGPPPTAYVVEGRNKFDGTVLWTFNSVVQGSAVSPNRLVPDQDWLWFAVSAAYGTIDPRTGGIIGIAVAAQPTNDIASDGAAVWLAVQGDDGPAVHKIRRGNTIRSWRRIDQTARHHLPLQQGIVPS